MAVITMPSSPAFQSSDWGIRRAVAVSESPFTGATQVQEYDKAQWYCTMTLPPMKRSQAAEWQAFFLKLRGRSNTFLLGDPDAKSVRGTATSVSVASTKAVGATEINLTLGSGKTLNTGSYIQFGTAGSSRLYMVVDDNTGDGNVTIEPPLKAQITTSTTVTIDEPKGLFRMDSNDLNWSANYMSNYGVTFSCSEAL